MSESTTQQVAKDDHSDDRLAALSAAGVSIWLDDLSRELIESGDLQRLIEDKHVVGVTTNPTIFASALSDGERYADQVQALAERGASVDEAIFEITTEDVRRGCDVLRPVFDRTDGVDGRVSIEVDPGLAHDTAATVETAKRLWEAVDRPNLFIKIPATVEGLPAISQVLAQGISVNVTLIFSLDRYRAVMQAFLVGLEQAREHGIDLSDHRLGRQLLRLARRRRDRQAARRDRLRRGARPARQGRRRQRPARLPRLDEVFSTPRWDVLAAVRRAPAAPAVGLHRREEPGLPADTVRRPSWSRRAW